MQGFGQAGALSGQAMGAYPSIMGAPLSMYGAMGDVGAQRRQMSQEAINQDMARYQYEATAPRPQTQLANYMKMISGDYGGTETEVAPRDNSALFSMLGTLGKAYMGMP
jgi:hypothetical protein